MDETLLEKILALKDDDPEFIKMVNESGLPRNWPIMSDAESIKSFTEEIENVVHNKKGEKGLEYFQEIYKNAYKFKDERGMRWGLSIDKYYRYALFVLNTEF